MAIENFITDARPLLTVASLLTFLGIVWWAYGVRRKNDFAEAARLPFADEEQPNSIGTENDHG